MKKLSEITGEDIKRISYGSDFGDDTHGAFEIKIKGETYFAIATGDFKGWDHVSISNKKQHKIPSWNTMCYLKDLFFYEDETVVQYHPAKKNYVDIHPGCLHLWKPTKETLPKPPKILV